MFKNHLSNHIPMTGSFISDVKKIFNDRGFFRGTVHIFTIIANLIRKTAWDKNELLFFLTDIIDGHEIITKDNTIILSVINAEGIKRAKNYFDGWFHREEALKVLARGDVLLGLWKEDTIIFYQWVSTKYIRFLRLGIEFEPPNGFCSMACMYTHPDYRGKGIASQSKLHVLKYLQQCGCRWCVGLISPKNETSQHINNKVGGVPYQNVRYNRILFLKIYRVEAVPSGKKAIFFKVGKKDNKIWKVFLPELSLLK